MRHVMVVRSDQPHEGTTTVSQCWHTQQTVNEASVNTKENQEQAHGQ